LFFFLCSARATHRPALLDHRPAGEAGFEVRMIQIPHSNSVALVQPHGRPASSRSSDASRVEHAQTKKRRAAAGTQRRGGSRRPPIQRRGALRPGAYMRRYTDPGGTSRAGHEVLRMTASRHTRAAVSDEPYIRQFQYCRRTRKGPRRRRKVKAAPVSCRFALL